MTLSRNEVTIVKWQQLYNKYIITVHVDEIKMKELF